MVDYQLGIPGTRKFSAPTAWEDAHELTARELSIPVRDRQNLGNVPVTVRRQRSYESMRTKLYVFHGSAASPQLRRGRVVVFNYDVGTYRNQAGNPVAVAVMPQNGSVIRRFNSTAAAREFINRDTRWPTTGASPPSLAGKPTSQIGGGAGIPTERVEALAHYRLVHAGTPVTRGPLRTPYPWVKTFERVPGATVSGTGPANATVTAAVRMNMTNLNRTFVYRQRVRTGPDGTFTMTLPYSTKGYDTWGTRKGYTNPSVRALGPYRLRTGLIRNETGARTQYSATFDVSEAHVIGENESTIQVELQPGFTIPAPGNRTSSVRPAGTTSYPSPWLSARP